MLKDNKLRHDYILGGNCYGYCKIEGFDGYIYGAVRDENIKREIDDEEFYFAEVKTSASDSDYHTFCYDYYFDGVFLNFNLNVINTVDYFGEDFSEELFPKDELIKIIENLLKEQNMFKEGDEHDVDIVNDCLKVTLPNKKLDEKTLECCKKISEEIRNYYDSLSVHITRMFGSYILLKKINGELKAVKSTPIPIKYCPLMIKLLKEVGGNIAEKLIASLDATNEEEQTKMMCELINEVVIKGGYFDTNRPLNSCEANVTFGASETMSSAFSSGLIDAAVIVSNNLGTIITTNAPGTQGAVKRMTGLFYTSPNAEIIKTAENEGIIPVFPYSARIDQLEGVKEAIRRGYKNIAVSVAAEDNKLHEELHDLEEKYNVTIYKFGLCSTGIKEDTAKIMEEYADVVWSCASKMVREYIDPSSIFQVGVKIPVYIMTEKGYELIKNHLELMNDNNSLDNVTLTKGEEMSVALNNSEGIKLIKRKELHNCADCPHPCI